MCLDDQVLNTYLDEELAEPWKSQVEEHLSYCKSCKKRFEELKSFKELIDSAELTDEEIRPHQDRVLALIENNYISKKKKVTVFSKKFQVSTKTFMGIAAAFVVVFVGSWAMFSGNSGAPMILPEAQTTIDIGNITPVSATENSKSLEDYTLDEILKSLDARGYEVDIRLKGIKPVDFSDAPAKGTPQIVPIN